MFSLRVDIYDDKSLVNALLLKKVRKTNLIGFLYFWCSAELEFYQYGDHIEINAILLSILKKSAVVNKNHR